MFKPLLARLVALSVITSPLAAQVTPSQTDQAPIVSSTANTARAIRPAAFVLGYKAELELTVEQVRQLERLARVQEDSVDVRQLRMSALMARHLRTQEANYAESQVGWAGAVDEKQIRADVCEQAAIVVEPMLNLMRDRTVVGSILTKTQIDRVLDLEISEMKRTLPQRLP